METYTVLHAVNLNGIIHAAGDETTLSTSTAAPLLAAGAITRRAPKMYRTLQVIGHANQAYPVGAELALTPAEAAPLLIEGKITPATPASLAE